MSEFTLLVSLCAILCVVGWLFGCAYLRRFEDYSGAKIIVGSCLAIVFGVSIGLVAALADSFWFSVAAGLGALVYMPVLNPLEIKFPNFPPMV